MSAARFDLEAARAALEARHPTWVPRTLAQALDAVAAERPARPFVITDDGAVSYADLAKWSTRLARGLVARGVAPGERVALDLPNGPEMVAAIFAVARAGAVAVPLNVRLRPRELGTVLGHSGAVALICVEAFRDADVLAVLDEIGDALPALGLVATVPGDAPSRRTAGTPLATLELEADPELDAELEARDRAADPGGPATIFYTSGTTGLPKGVVLSHDMELRSAYGSAYTRAFEDGRRILFALPLHHVFAYVEGLLASLFVAGALIAQAAFDPVETLDAIERHRAAEALFVPTMTLAVLEAARAHPVDTSSLHAVMSAAAVCPARVWAELQDVFGVTELVTAYGMTETSAATTFTMPHDPVDLMIETVGRPKLGGVAAGDAPEGRLAVYGTVDPDTGAALPAGATGELVVRGPIVTRGYHDDPGQTAAAIDADGWLRSGDLGYVRDDGYLVLTGRSKDLYKCGGEQVMPAEVEGVLTARPDVAQAHVVAVPDERMGEVGCAWIVPAEGAAPSAQELIEHCRAELARFKVPAHVLFCSAAELPLTASGKVQKFVLAERAMVALPGA